MEIMRAVCGGGFTRVGMRCDRCGHEARACRSLAEEFAMSEFVRIDVHAGYGAEHFSDGDSWAVDLCERCLHELLAPYLRLVRSAEERELQSATSRVEALHCGDWIDHLYQVAAERRVKSRHH